MRDRRDSDTNQYPTVSGGRSQQTQRNLFLGVGGFVIAFLVIGLLLLSGRDDDDTSGALATNTRSASPTVAQTQESVAATDSEPTQSAPAQAVTETVGDVALTATVEPGIPTVTPSDPATLTPVAEPTEPVPTEDSTAEEPVATEEPAEEVPDPTAEPIVGEFGQLPPVQIVSGGLERSVDLEYVLDDAAFSAPDIAPVYQIQWKLWSGDDLATIAANLGVDGEVEDFGGDDYQVSGSESSLFAGPTPSGQPIIQYESYVERLAEPLPDDGTLVNLAHSFLIDSGIISNAGEGNVVARDDNSGVAVVEFKPAEPTILLAALPAATVTFGPGGVVEMAEARWPADYVVSDYSLRSTGALWNDVLSGEASFDADLSAVPDGSLAGSFTVTDIGTAYSLAGADYLAPLVVFYGDVYFTESDVTVPMRIYVQAVAGQDAPAG